ncbi:Adaptor for signal transduction [Mortierella sp. GBA43]|nr:Adaptor for signal transduction [Mortierella sp. GBA43]
MESSVTQWDPSRVHQWMCSIGFPNYEKQIRDNAITGDLLIHLDHAALKDLSIWEVGKRLMILKAIYQLKMSNGISVEAGDYIPPNNTIQHLAREVERMSKDLSKVRDELWAMQKDQKPLPEPSPGYAKSVNGQSSSSSMLSASSNHSNPPASPIHATHLGSVRSPGLATDSGFQIPSSPHSPADTRARSNTETGEDGKGSGVDGAGAIKVYGQKPSNTVDAFRSFRISQDDPCYKVLPAALKKYKINDDWRQYALFICYGNTGKWSAFQRILTYNEKPLLLMKQLKENKESPVFMLKHIKQMKSPAVNTASPPSSLPPRKSTDLLNKELPIPPESMGGAALSVGSGLTNNMSAQMNGGGASQTRSGMTASTISNASTVIASSSSSITGANGRSDSSSGYSTTTMEPKPENYVQETVEASGTAVALYEWEAKRDDELNVKVGDEFKIKSKGHGWWIVQRGDEIGWIPASILSENESNSEDGYLSADGVAIFDFAKTGPNELSIKTGDKLKIFRRHQHWLLATCEGQRGWVPSWFVSLDPQ